MQDASIQAWNNFIFKSEPNAYEKGSPRWAAATAADFMGLACNGGLYYFLDSSCDLDPRDVVDALKLIDAGHCTTRLDLILNELGRPLPVSTTEERESILRECWKESLNEIDTLSGVPYADLIAALEAHVKSDEAFYLSLSTNHGR